MALACVSGRLKLPLTEMGKTTEGGGSNNLKHILVQLPSEGMYKINALWMHHYYSILNTIDTFWGEA